MEATKSIAKTCPVCGSKTMTTNGELGVLKCAAEGCTGEYRHRVSGRKQNRYELMRTVINNWHDINKENNDIKWGRAQADKDFQERLDILIARTTSELGKALVPMMSRVKHHMFIGTAKQGAIVRKVRDYTVIEGDTQGRINNFFRVRVEFDTFTFKNNSITIGEETKDFEIYLGGDNPNIKNLFKKEWRWYKNYFCKGNIRKRRVYHWLNRRNPDWKTDMQDYFKKLNIEL